MDTNQLVFKTEPGIVEICKEDIAQESGNSDDEYRNELNFAPKILSTNGDNYNIPQIKCKFKLANENCIKIETEDSLDELSDHFTESWVISKSNNNNNIQGEKLEPEITEFLDENNIIIKTEDDSSDISSHHFAETSIKVEKPAEFDSAFFDREYNEAYIKEDIDIEIEDHKIKLETNEDSAESEHKQEKQNETKKSKATLKCKFCTYQTHTQSSFKKHLSLHEDPNKVLLYFCTKCSYRTRQKCHLKRHDLIHQESAELKMFTCEICYFKTKQKCTLKRHIHSVHVKHISDTKKNNDIESEVLSCSECSYSTFKKGLLISHLDKHKDTRDLNNLYICDICSFCTKYRRNLRMHLDTHKESQELQVYECKICSFKTRMGYCLKRHFLSKKHLKAAGKIEEYCPRPQKL